MSTHDFPWHVDAWRLARASIGRGAHALLIAGMRGLGKREFALRLAAHYLCAARPVENAACGTCESCRWLAAGTHPDFVLIEPPEDDDASEAGGASRAKPIGVDQVRQLDDALALSAHRGAGKAVVLRPAERMNLSAANALLKNLEEPPAGVLFLLVTDRPALLLPTVKSRCLTVRIRLAPLEQAATWLEQAGCEHADLQLALCGGAPVEALASATDGMAQRRREFLQRLTAESDDPIGLAERFRDLPPPLVLIWLQKWTFDLTLARIGGRVRYNVDMAEAAGVLARRTSPVSVSRAHRRLVALQRHAHHPLNPRLFLEQMLLTYRAALSDGSLHV